MKPLLRACLCLTLLVALSAVACTVSETPTGIATAVPATSVPEVTPTQAVPVNTPARALFSEMIPGIPGDNNFEFIELYNAGTETLDLRGWSIWYRLNDAQEETRLYRWAHAATIPGQGHYLLVREGTELGVLPDAFYDTPLFERWGALQLRDAEGQTVDTVGWGKAIGGFSDALPAATPVDGASLERMPGGSAGSGQDTDDGSTDFLLRPEPQPQNSGMAATPLPEQRLDILATAPLTVTPGTSFVIEVIVQNLTSRDLRSVRVTVPLPDGVVVESLALTDGAESDRLDLLSEDDGKASSEVAWVVPELAAGAVHRGALTVRSPWRYGNVYLSGYRVGAADWPLSDFGPVVLLTVSGGAIPIGTARTLVGNVVTIEGTVTMYSGGFFAGSTGTKFYVQDESGGTQVYCPGGKGVIVVRIGDRVRVTGGIEVYRDSLELVPATYPDDVEVLDLGKVEISPLDVTAYAATHDEAVPGSLIQVEGTVTRFEEFSYSYEVDLLDEQGDRVLVDIEKETGLNPEFLELGDTYRVAGVSEIYDGQWQLKPRVAEDFVRVYPKELMLDVTAQNSVEAGGLVTTTLTAHNYTDSPLTSVVITATVPMTAVDLLSASDSPVSVQDGELVWTVPEVPPEGGSAMVTYVVQLKPSVTEGSFETSVRAAADEWPDTVSPEPWRVFVGSGVPIWAIQGSGFRSPFALSAASTEGIVTGVFPDQGGFWIQSLEPDDDVATSEGLFVQVDTEELDPAPDIGDYVIVVGKVRERSGQTMLDVASTAEIEVITGTFDMPAPVELNPPRDEVESRAYYESLEGMMVKVSAPALAVGPTNQYGETPLILPSWGLDRIMKGEPKGMLIFVDDGSSATHVDRTTLPYAAKTGDLVAEVVGPLAFTYENFKIQPITTPTVISEAVVLPRLVPVGPDAFSIATFNVENFFDVLDPHPSSPERPSIKAYRARVEKAAATIEAMGAPTIVGVQEVENIGILEDVAEHALIVDYGYVPVLVEGSDSRGIDVGYLVRGDQATLEGVSQHDAPEGLTSRPPLMITVTVHLASGDETVTVINNHFLSMSGGELPTEPRRVAQAAWNVSLVETLLAGDPDAQIVVLGDLNSFYNSPPLDVFREAGLHHVYEFVEPALLYTYIYQGESETLDHILVSRALYDHLRRVDALHVNADYPPAIPEDTSPQRLSDHDPLVAVFGFGE
ncbi:MAG: lamin tail domain-containing protein [Anaerolineae bacterium]|nr:lamin tail domain-containing protein [Anaerolineae bacterium]